MIRTDYEASKSITPIYADGNVDVSADNSWVVTALEDDVVITHLHTGERLHELPTDTSGITALACTKWPAATGFIVAALRSNTLFIYRTPDFVIHTKIPRAHEAPVVTIAMDPSGTLCATGASDGTVKVWDLDKGHCTHVFRGHGGVVSSILFDIVIAEADARPSDIEGVFEPYLVARRGVGARARLAVGSDDTRVKVWDLYSRKTICTLDNHTSVVRGLVINSTGDLLASAGRDSVINLWSLPSGKLLKTVPTLDPVEAMVLANYPSLESQEFLLATAGETQLAVWDLEKQDKPLRKLPLRHATLDSCLTFKGTSPLFTLADSDRNFSQYELPDLDIEAQVSGFNDEITDLAFTPHNELAVATNSNLIRLYSLDKFFCHFLEGHTGTVLAVTAGSKYVYSASQDTTIRVWDRERQVAMGTGHVEGVGALALSASEKYLVSGSRDQVVKIWNVADIDESRESIVALHTQHAHDKDINSVDIASDDSLVATGSQDRTAKVWHMQPNGILSLQATFQGHRRGIWSVKFSPDNKYLATASTDNLIKVWDLSTNACIKTFEGHTSSVLRVDFISQGTQLVSSASDGLVKIWDIKTEQAITTLDDHEDKVWAIAVRDDGGLIASGGADSNITLWTDVSVEKKENDLVQHNTAVLAEQDFDNYVMNKDYANAIVHALKNNQKNRLYTLMSNVASLRDTEASFSGSAEVDSVLRGLDPDQLRVLVDAITSWNSVAKTAHIAQHTLYTLLKLHAVSRIVDALSSSGNDPMKVLDILHPYTERHYQRTDRILRESYLIDHLVSQMEVFD